MKRELKGEEGLREEAEQRELKVTICVQRVQSVARFTHHPDEEGTESIVGYDEGHHKGGLHTPSR